MGDTTSDDKIPYLTKSYLYQIDGLHIRCGLRETQLLVWHCITETVKTQGRVTLLVPHLLAM